MFVADCVGVVSSDLAILEGEDMKMSYWRRAHQAIEQIRASRKGAVQMGDIMQIGLVMGVGIVVLVIVALILNGLQTSASVVVNSAAYNISGYGSSFLLNMSSTFPLIGLIVGFVLLLGIVAGIGLLGYMGYQSVRGR